MKIELCVKLSVLRWFQVGHLMYKIGEVHFRLLGTNVFHAKAKNERLSAASSRCRHNLKYENFTTSFGRLRQNIAPKSVPHVQHDYFSSFNQSSHWFVAMSWSLPSSFVKLPFIFSTRHLASSRSQDMEFACGCYGFPNPNPNPNYSTPACQEPTVCLLPIMSNCLWFLAKDYF